MIHGRRCRLYVGKKEICQVCKLHLQCLIKKAQHQTLAVPIPGPKWTITEARKQKVDSEEGRKIYAKRLVWLPHIRRSVPTKWLNHPGCRRSKTVFRISLHNRFPAKYGSHTWGGSPGAPKPRRFF
jgi:hypothetical protein